MGSLNSVNNFCFMSKFADDVTSICPIFHYSSNDHILQEHNSFVNWSTSKLLILNKDKCKWLIFTKPKCKQDYSTPIIQMTVVNKLRILGVIFDNSLHWDSHITHVTCIASRRLYCLRVLKQFFNCKQLLLIYKSYIRSILEYCPSLLVGLNVNLSHKLESVQKRAYRIIYGESLVISEHEKLSNRRLKASIKLFHKAQSKSHCLNYILPPKSQFSNRYILPHITSTRKLHSFTIETTIALNSL